MQEGDYKILVIIVDDGSTDPTSLICKSIISKYAFKKNIVANLIRQENKGIAVARNADLNILKVKYIMFLDLDDFLPINSIVSLMNYAEKTNSDTVQGSWFDFDKTVKVNHIVDYNCNKISGYPWGKIYRYSVLEHFKFPDGYWFEDTPISYILLGMSIKIFSTKDIIYAYHINSSSIIGTYTNSAKSIDTY